MLSWFCPLWDCSRSFLQPSVLRTGRRQNLVGPTGFYDRVPAEGNSIGFYSRVSLLGISLLAGEEHCESSHQPAMVKRHNEPQRAHVSLIVKMLWPAAYLGLQIGSA